MYGEDIDLSWRIRLAGFQNYYFPGTTILHFKGESTPEDIHHIKMFYAAMELFIRKHLSGGPSELSFIFLKTGVLFYRMLAFLRLPFKKWKRKRTISPVILKGDADSLLLVKKKLALKNLPVSENEGAFLEVIYCEGAEKTWKSILGEISQDQSGHPYKFHGKATHAAVGSMHGDKKGQVLVL
jgi:N-acetylglucosaminyl-diphospho-decaprenol L-rhamnosyltransferase